MSRFVNGLAWNSLASAVTQGGGLLRLFFVAAAIGPHGMGALAIAASVQAAIASLTEFGVCQTYIAGSRFEDLTDEQFLGSTWITDLALKCLLLAVALPLGIFTAQFFTIQELPGLIVGLTAATAIASFTNPVFLDDEKKGRFRRIALTGIAAQSCGIAVAILIAICTQSAWSLVAGNLVVSMVQVLVSYLSASIPPLRPDWDTIRRILIQGRHFTSIAVTTFITYSLDKLLVGFLVSERVAGLFFIGCSTQGNLLS